MTDLIRLGPTLANTLIAVGGLILLLVAALHLRALLFCQYLRELTGIRLSVPEVRRTYGRLGRDGVRGLLLDRTIAADLAENPPVIPPGAH